jgi:hypothetical protein
MRSICFARLPEAQKHHGPSSVAMTKEHYSSCRKIVPVEGPGNHARLIRKPLGLLLSEKQDSPIIVNIRNQLKTDGAFGSDFAPLGAGVGRSNRPAPTN